MGSVWNNGSYMHMDYDEMLQQLDTSPMSSCRKYWKLTTMYNIILTCLLLVIITFPSGVFDRRISSYNGHQDVNAYFISPFGQICPLGYSTTNREPMQSRSVANKGRLVNYSKKTGQL